MTDRPILFSAPMVLALLAGRKTQTRRIIDFEGVGAVLEFVKVATDQKGRAVYEMYGANRKPVSRPAGKHFVEYQYWPPIAVGDTLWVREAWHTFVSLNTVPPRDLWVKDGPRGAGIAYLADDMGLSITRDGRRSMGEREEESAFGRYRPGMHMPRWASRITLEVTDVRVERLQDISHEDALAEGIQPWNSIIPFGVSVGQDAVAAGRTAPLAYRTLWNHINGDSAWDANPWVVAYSFTVHHRNIDMKD